MKGYLKIMTYKLISTNVVKLLKSEQYGYLNGMVSLSAYKSTIDNKEINLCPNADKYKCFNTCISFTGNAIIFPDMIAKGRYKRTELFVKDRKQFKDNLRHDIEKLINQANKKGLRPALRFNGLSDVNASKVYKDIITDYSDVIDFYDYTKMLKYCLENPFPDKYNIVFSASYLMFQSVDMVKDLLKKTSLVIVYPKSNYCKDKSIPDNWKGIPVVDGDKQDVRLERNKLIFLRFKGGKESLENQMNKNLIILPYSYL